MGATLLKSFMPDTAEKDLRTVKYEGDPVDELGTFGHYVSGTKVTETPEILFARLDIEEVMKKVEELHPKKEESEAAAGEEGGIDIEAKPEITFEDFEKLQFQIGEVIACEAVPKSKSCFAQKVKIGSSVKQIVSGIHKYYTPEEMVGKKVMVL